LGLSESEKGGEKTSGHAIERKNYDWLGGLLAATNNDYGKDRFENSVDAFQEGKVFDGLQYGLASGLEAIMDGANSIIKADTGINPVSMIHQGLIIASAIPTPYGPAFQSDDQAFLDLRNQVIDGATLYKLGTAGKSDTAEAQFWAIENPLTTPDYAKKYGIPEENIKNYDFVETAVLRDGSAFVTRPAPGFGNSPGGGPEVVVERGGVEIRSFISLP
jgi:hypothetical protein